MKAEANWSEAKAGRDPRASVLTLEEATEKVIALHRDGWKAGSRIEAQWRASFATHLYPALGQKPVSQITSSDLVDVLGPLVHSKPAQAKILRRRLSQVMRWAVTKGYRSSDPAGDVLTAALPRPNGKTTTHYKALHYSAVASMLRQVDGSGANQAIRLATRFLTLTAVRSGEVRGARWSEIDTEAAVWTIGANRMKSGREHRVPLSKAALAVLAEARERRGSEGLIFPGRGGKQVSHNGIAGLFRRLKIEGTPHGLRSSFRDWCGETGVPREVAEACLAHVVKGVEGAYARSDLLERRRAVMEAWGEYLS